MLALITGPVRSGKSRRAASVARGFGDPVTFVATLRLDPHDPEMIERIAHHRREREDALSIELWRPQTPDLPAVIATAPPATTLLIDSLGTWLAGHLLDLEALAEYDAPAALTRLEAFGDALADELESASCNVVIVSEEAGWGLVPPTPQGRIFRDALGRLSQRIGRRAERVELVVAGFALDLRRHGVPV